MKSLSTHLRFLHPSFCILVALAYAPAAFAQHESMTRNFECFPVYGMAENVSDFVAKDHYVFLDHGGKLRILDIVDPSKPQEIACMNSLEGGIVGINGPALYFCGYDKFNMVDISDPCHPHPRGSFDVDLQEFTPHLMGNYLLADEARKNGNGYIVFNIQEPFEPKELTAGSHEYYTFVDPFYTDGIKFYEVRKEKSGLCRLQDLTSSPTTVAVFQYSEEMEIDFKIDKGKVFVEYPGHSILLPILFKGGTIWQMDPYWHQKTYADGWVMDRCSSYANEYLEFARASKPKEIVFHTLGGMAALTKGAFYLMDEPRIYDLSGSKPVDKGAFPGMAKSFTHIRVSGSVAIVDGEGSLRFYNISDPIKPVLCGEYRFPTHRGVKQAKISGDRAYLIDGDSGLVILDISNPKSPRLLARHQQAKNTSILTLQGDCLFLADGDAGFHGLDCSVPISPKVFGRCHEGAGPMCITGSSLYMVKDGLKILDISDLKSVHTVGSFKTDSPSIDIATSGTMVFLLTADAVQAIDAADSSKPVLIEKIQNPRIGEKQYLKRLHNAIYLVTVNGAGIGISSTCDVIDISNPASMSFLTLPKENLDYEEVPEILPANPAAKYPGWYLGLPFAEHSSCDTNSGLRIYDCSEPLHPRLAGYYDGESICTQHVLLYKDNIYLPDEDAGLLVIQHTK